MKIKHVFTIAILALVVGLLLGRSCVTKTDYWKGQYDALKAKHSQIESQIKALTAANEKLAKQIADFEKSVADKNKQIGQLTKKVGQLEGAERLIKDKDALIVNLRAQIAAWKEKFSLAEGIIGDQNKIIFNLKQQYANEKLISAEWKAKYEGEHEIRLACEKWAKELVKQNRASRFWQTTLGVTTIVIAGYVAYDLVKK